MSFRASCAARFVTAGTTHGRATYCPPPTAHRSTCKGDVLDALASRAWQLAVFFPPCTFLCSSGLHWNTRRPARAADTEAALDFVRRLLEAPVPHLALENPRGVIGTRIRRADQVITPHAFGDDASKETHLWLKNLPPLSPLNQPALFASAGPPVPGARQTARPIEPRFVAGRPRWSNQTDSGQNKLSQSARRWALRSETYPGIAAAMADQWGAHLRAAAVDA